MRGIDQHKADIGPDEALSPDSSRKRSWMGALARFLLWSVAAVLLLCFNLSLALGWILDSRAVSPILQMLCRSKLNADVTASDADLTIFSTFPQATICIDGLRIVSHSLPDSAAIPSSVAHPDLLFDNACLQVTVNAPSLLTRDIEIPSVRLLHPYINVVAVNDSTGNFMIVKPQKRSRLPKLNVNVGEVEIDNADFSFVHTSFSRSPFTGTVSASLMLDQLPNIDLRRLDVNTAFLDLECSGKMIRGRSALIEGRVKSHIDAEQVPPPIENLVNGNYEGSVDLDLAVRFHTDDFTGTGFRRIRASGVLDIERPQINIASSALAISGHSLHLCFGDGTPKLNRLDEPLRAHLAIDSAAMTLGKFGLGVGDLVLDIAPSDSVDLPKGADIAPMRANLAAGGLNVLLTNGARVLFTNAHMAASLTGADPVVDADITTDLFSFLINGNRVNLNSAHSHLHTRPRAQTPGSGATVVASIDSTTSVLQVHMSPMIHSMVDGWVSEGEINASNGDLISPRLSTAAIIGPLHLEFSPKGIDIDTVSVSCANSDLHIAGHLASAPGGRFTGDIELWGESLDITALQHSFVPAAPAAPEPWIDSVPPPPQSHMISFDIYRPDRMATLVPSNINATTEFSFDRALCGGVPLSNLSGKVKLNRGSLRLENARATTAGGELLVNAAYVAPQADSLRFELTTNVSGINLRDLHAFMPLSQYVSPYLDCISGVVDANLQFNGTMSPQMSVLPSTFRGHLDISSPRISIKSSDLVGSIARKLLFVGDAPDNFDNFNINIDIKDEKITLQPANLQFARYELVLQGESNFNGGYEFHLGVAKSPIPWKFGINIAGNLNGKPAIKFGGFHTKSFKHPANDEHKLDLFKHLNDFIHRHI